MVHAEIRRCQLECGAEFDGETDCHAHERHSHKLFTPLHSLCNPVLLHRHTLQSSAEQGHLSPQSIKSDISSSRFGTSPVSTRITQHASKHFDKMKFSDGNSAQCRICRVFYRLSDFDAHLNLRLVRHSSRNMIAHICLTVAWKHIM